MNNVNDDIISMFGLTEEQTKIMFTIQKKISETDCEMSKGSKQYAQKKLWIEEWEDSIINYVNSSCNDKIDELYDTSKIGELVSDELSKSNNKTWLYIVALECLTFTPYIPIGSENDKNYKHCKFEDKKCDFVFDEIFSKPGYISKDKIERIKKCYDKSVDKISGKGQKIAIRVLSVVAAAALVALFTALMAPEIAVALVGAEFEGLAGAALTSACLAAIGGGAITAGGLGMAGGVAVIAGGGALLGLAGSGAAAGITSVFSNSPEFTLTQSAKLETILKEVVLNAQQDVVTAQAVISKLQQTIDEMNKKLVDLQLNDAKNKKDIKNLKKSIEYMMNGYKNMNSFESAYELGLNIQKTSEQ